jgi:RsiW-degrading membrane proteinase PrsW (M82 family)
MDVETAKIMRKMVQEAIESQKKKENKLPPVLVQLSGLFSGILIASIFVLKIIGALSWPWWIVVSSLIWGIVVGFVGTALVFYILVGLLSVVFGFVAWIVATIRRKK